MIRYPHTPAVIPQSYEQEPRATPCGLRVPAVHPGCSSHTSPAHFRCTHPPLSLQCCTCSGVNSSVGPVGRGRKERLAGLAEDGDDFAQSEICENTKKTEFSLDKIAAGILLREEHLSGCTPGQELPHHQCSQGICWAKNKSNSCFVMQWGLEFKYL